MRLLLCILAVTLISPLARGAKMTFDENGVLEIDGKKTFVISFALPPPPDAKAPDGQDALAVLHDAGANFMRIANSKHEPDSPESLKLFQAWLDDAAKHHMYCWITLGDLPSWKAGDRKKEDRLRAIINRFKDHPGLGAWKARDEAAWSKVPADNLKRAYDVFHQLDPDHPVVLIQAPTKASLPLAPYYDTCDVTGVDIYPIAYPPGKHSDFGNREMSVVSDCTQWIMNAARAGGAQKPVWMTLQIAWGGVASPGKTLRFPTFEQSRYMAYTAIINGARGINYQGPALPTTLNPRDAKLGWNWTFWQQTMHWLVEELGEKSPLNPALLAADSRLPIKLAKPTDVEFCVREVGNQIFILAAKREGATEEVTFTGLPDVQPTADVLFEEPRKISPKSAQFTDWFAPHDVHVYRFTRKGGD